MHATFSENLAFVIMAVVTLIPAVMVVTIKNLVHAALLLGVSFVGVAGLYLILNAEFIAAAQVLVYVGAITVLILFAIMLTSGVSSGRTPQSTVQTLLGAATSAFVFIVLGRFLYSHHWPGVVDPAPVMNGPAVLGKQLLTTFIIPFEVSSVLLLVALIAAIVLARDEDIVSIPVKNNVIYGDDDMAQTVTLGSGGGTTAERT